MVNKGGSGCTTRHKCGACEGDCDRDADCVAGLKCFQRNSKVAVNGCAPGGSGDMRSNDYCYDPKTSKYRADVTHSGT